MKHYSNGHMTLNDYLMMYLARWKRGAVVLIVIWIVVTYLFIAPLRCTGNTDEVADFQARLKRVSSQLDALKQQHNNLISQIRKSPGLRGNLKDLDPSLLLDSGQGPTEEYENLRRRIYSNTKELWYFISHELNAVLKTSDNREETLITIMDHINDRKRTILSDQEKLPELDGYHEWRKTEAANVSDLIQRRLYHLQNPPDCKDARKVICNLNKELQDGSLASTASSTTRAPSHRSLRHAPSARAQTPSPPVPRLRQCAPPTWTAGSTQARTLTCKVAGRISSAEGISGNSTPVSVPETSPADLAVTEATNLAVSDEGIFGPWFSILSNGSVTVSQRLDRSRAAVLTLPVTVIDASALTQQQADGELIITIVDVNRHAPMFSQPAYEENLVEEQPMGSVLNTYSATDRETPIAAMVISPPSPYFQIDNVSVSHEAKVVSLPFIDSISQKPKFLPLAVPKDLAHRIIRFNGDPPSWWIGQILKYILKPRPAMQKVINETIAKINFQSPIVGVHIRRTDKVGTEAAFHHIHEYMAHVSSYYEQLERTRPVTTRRVYLATDDANVLEDARKKYPDYEFLGDPTIAKTAATHRRYTPVSLTGLLLDLHMLSMCDYIVCTFSSQVGRVAYEMMQANRVDASDSFFSLDDIYYFGGQNAHDRIAVMAHSPSTNQEIAFQSGDLIGIAGNHWNGFGRGTNKRTNLNGLIPWYKTAEHLVLYPFPEYKHVPLYSDTRQNEL